MNRKFQDMRNFLMWLIKISVRGFYKENLQIQRGIRLIAIFSSSFLVLSFLIVEYPFQSTPQP